MNICDDVPCADAWFQVHNEAPMFHWLSRYCEEIPHLLLCNAFGKFKLFKLSSQLSACRNSSCTNHMIKKNINNVTHTFLWIAKLDSKFPFISLSIVPNQFIKLFLMKPPVAGTGHPLHHLSHQSPFSQCAILTLFGPAMHTAQVNTVIMINNLHSAVNSIGETPLSVKRATTACSSIKGHQQVLSVGFCFHTQ